MALKAESEAATARPPLPSQLPTSACHPLRTRSRRPLPTRAASPFALGAEPRLLRLHAPGTRLPSDMDDDREKHSVCTKCVKLKVPK